MESELEGQLHGATRQQLLILARELASRHPQLHIEMSELLTYATSVTNRSTPYAIGLENVSDYPVEDAEAANSTIVDESGEIDEDWDFGGNEPLPLKKLQHPNLKTVDSEAYRKRLATYAQRLQQGESPQSLFDDLNAVLEEAETHAEQHDYQGTIDLYALVLDERLREAHPALVHHLDKVLDDIMPILETVLSEVSSNIFFDSTSLTPFMPLEVRQQWLERLFSLWLKRLDAHYLDESIPEMMLNMAWSEDVSLLHRMVQNELQQLPLSEHSNIVDFSRQYRTRTLERFLKELPRS